MLSLLPTLSLALGLVQPDTSYLYRTQLLRAAPGTLLEVIEAFTERTAVYQASDGAPFIMRHRQGDQWDLLLLFPMESFPTYYSAERIARRERAAAASGVSEPEFATRIATLVSRREEVYVLGPPLEEVSRSLGEGTLYHIEMFLALPDKRDALFREREMENAYLVELDRPQNLIFTRTGGAAWDLFTVGVYRDYTHFAASDLIPDDREEAAALAAGFAGASYISSYLRTLIQYHQDTLAGAVR
jgi:hypothetical protein